MVSIHKKYFLIYLFQVKILSTCLHEEKERYKQLDVKFKDKTTESSKLLDRIAHMRQKVMSYIITVKHWVTLRHTCQVSRF